MASVAKALRAQYPPDKVYILVAKRNSGSFTYDGIECGGERVCLEIEEELEMIHSKGGHIKKLSIVGYSLGGLVARYAIGLLSTRGVLDNLECMVRTRLRLYERENTPADRHTQNFTAFASPFLGVRTPLRGWANQLFNVLGARTLCMSGRQLFGIDRFRDTGKPLLAVLADPNSIFMSGLARFKRHTLYANITNDRSAVYYTTGISKTDPYTDLSRVNLRFLEGWEDVILDPLNPVSPAPPADPEPLTASLDKLAKRVPIILALTLFIPIGVVAFLVNSAQDQAYLLDDDDEGDLSDDNHGGATPSGSDGDESDGGRAILALERKMSRQEGGAFPTLALAPYQFAAVQALERLPWRKYPVWIKVQHSHAAIIVRMDKPSFDEGRVVLRHWVTEEFLV